METPESVAADIRAEGFLMTLQRTTTGEYDPVYGFGESTTQSYSIYGLLSSYNGSEYREGSLIQVGDKKATVEAGVIAPRIGDRILINGELWSVMMVDAVNPQGVDLMYKLQVRK